MPDIQLSTSEQEVFAMKFTKRRQFLSMLGFTGVSLAANKAYAHHTDTHFDDDAKHKLVYLCT